MFNNELVSDQEARVINAKSRTDIVLVVNSLVLESAR